MEGSFRKGAAFFVTIQSHHEQKQSLTEAILRMWLWIVTFLKFLLHFLFYRL